MKRRNVYGSATAACAALALGAVALAGGSSASSEPAAAPVIHSVPAAVQIEKPAKPAKKHRAAKARSAAAESAPAQSAPAQPDTSPQPQSDTTAEAPGASEPTEPAGGTPEPAGDTGPNVDHQETGDHQGENGGGPGTGGDNGAPDATPEAGGAPEDTSGQ